MKQIILVFLVNFCLFNHAIGQKKSSLSEIVKISDNIFIGTVDSIKCVANEKGMPLTLVKFKNIESGKSTYGNYDLQYAGGVYSDRVIEVSHTPRFEIDKTYLIFASDNSKGYMTPIIDQYFEIIQDDVSSDRYMVTINKHPVIEIDNDKLKNSYKKLISIKEGTPVYEYPSDPFRQNIPPKAIGDVIVGISPLDELFSANPTPLTLQELMKYLSDKFNIVFTSKKESQFNKKKENDRIGAKNTATPTISFCGSHDLYIVMEQLPTSFTPWYDINHNCMWVWNQYMDIFRYSVSDGMYGKNDVNEFGGFPTSASLISAYGSGFGWGTGTLAVAIWSRPSGGCTKLVESDVFVNPSTPMTINLWDQINGTHFMYMPTIMHELGHVWGLMTNQTETYDYSLPTVMQGGSFGIVEDGVGIHPADAELLRNAYQSQTSIIPNIDIAVESYFAPGGLVSSTTDALYYFAGNPIIINGITAENNSSSSVANLYLNFYLSLDPLINSADYYMGSVYWPTFNAESYSSYNYTLTIPAHNIPSGSYFVGATATYNVTSSDGFIGNNATFLPKKIYIYGTEDISEIQTPNKLNIIKGSTANEYWIINDLKCSGRLNVYNSIGQLISTQDLSETKLLLPNVSGIYAAEIITNDSKQVFKLIN